MSYQKDDNISFKEIIDENANREEVHFPNNGVTIPLGPYSGTPSYTPIESNYAPTSISSNSSQYSHVSPTASDQFIASSSISSPHSQANNNNNHDETTEFNVDLTQPPNGVTIHLFVGIVATLVTFLVWHYVMSASARDKDHIWWWMFVPFFFAMTLTAHVHYYTGNYFKAIVVNMVLVNIMLFVVDAQSVC